MTIPYHTKAASFGWPIPGHPFPMESLPDADADDNQLDPSCCLCMRNQVVSFIEFWWWGIFLPCYNPFFYRMHHFEMMKIHENHMSCLEFHERLREIPMEFSVMNDMSMASQIPPKNPPSTRNKVEACLFKREQWWRAMTSEFYWGLSRQLLKCQSNCGGEPTTKNCLYEGDASDSKLPAWCPHLLEQIHFGWDLLANGKEKSKPMNDQNPKHNMRIHVCQISGRDYMCLLRKNLVVYIT